MKYLIAILTVALLGVGVYLFYVRGLGKRAHVPEPRIILSGNETKTYAWQIKREMPTPRTEVTAAVLNGRMYVIDGLDGFARTVATVEIYDPATDSWSRGPDLPEGRHHAAAAVVDERLYVIGGFTGIGFKPTADVFRLDAQGRRWEGKAPLPNPRGALAVGVREQ